MKLSLKRILPILLFSYLHGNSQNAELIYKTTVNSTVTIETENGLGSGFFIGNNLIATNYHVIEGSIEAYCYLNKSENKYKIEGYVALDTLNDLVLLKVPGLNKPQIKFASNSAVIGQNVFVIGSPKGLAATISNGIISGLRDFSSKELIQITAPISPGSSGGPVLNSQGLLIGVSVGQFSQGQNLNFAIPAKHLKKLMNNMFPVKQLMNLDEGLISYLNMVYTSVTIGPTTWMSTNLNVSRFRNGDSIPQVTSEEEWENAGKEGKPAWCYYNNDASNGEKYGKLYNWYAVADSRGLAPKGWHISTTQDWKRLALSIGGDFAGSELKTTTEWIKGQGSNSTEFSAFPSGARWPNAKFRNFGTAAFFWTSNNIDNESAGSILLDMNSHNISHKLGSKSWGMSIRCVKD